MTTSIPIEMLKDLYFALSGNMPDVRTVTVVTHDGDRLSFVHHEADGWLLEETK